MKALVVEKDLSLGVKDIPEPKINSFEAKCEILACGICGSDKRILQGIPFIKVPPAPYPLVLGHETVGKVVEIGQHVTKFKVGDIVTCPFNLTPDGYGGAWGGFAEYGTVFDGTAVRFLSIIAVDIADEKWNLLRFWNFKLNFNDYISDYFPFNHYRRICFWLRLI